MNDTATPWWRNRSNLPFMVFLAIVGYFFLTEHKAHVIAFLPWLLLLGCVFMYLFMHGGHGHGSGGDTEQPGNDEGGHPR